MRTKKLIPLKNKIRFAFVVDGKCESWYFQMLKRNEPSISISIDPIIPQKKTLSEQYEKVIKLTKVYTKVFWIVDFDVICKETIASKKSKKTALQEFENYYHVVKNKLHNVSIIINNPCFEFWFLIHFETTTRYFENYEKLFPQLQKHELLNGYEKSQRFYTQQNNDIYLRLKPFLPFAIKNSNNFMEFDFRNPHTAISQMSLFFNLTDFNSFWTNSIE